MVDLEFFPEPEEVRRLVRELEDVSKLSPEEVFAYLIELSEVILSLYIVMRDSLPRGYGRVKFSRFVEKKRRQVENMHYLAREIYPEVQPEKKVKFSTSFSIETVGDYARALRNAIYLESLSLKAFRYLSKFSAEKLLFGDLAEEIEENVKELEEELKKVESIEEKLRFSEFVKELVGDRNG